MFEFMAATYPGHRPHSSATTKMFMEFLAGQMAKLPTLRGQCDMVRKNAVTILRWWIPVTPIPEIL
jgi:hypothetical protein